MKKIDVLIIYEHSKRELENCALLKAELIRRGLNVEVLYMYSMPKRWCIEARIIIVPHIYDEGQLRFFVLNKKSNNRNVIDLQYEQVLSESSEDGIHNPSGLAREAHHIAWGKAQVDRYLRHGIAMNKIHETGSISMDLLRNEFSEYFKSKEEIGLEFNIDFKKEWVLFISSFSYANRSPKEIEALSILDPNAFDFAEISNKSYKEILRWLEEALQKYPEKVFIYRKHPAELSDDNLKKIESRYANFRCIDSYSMRQWSIIVDKIYNWYSTSLADVFFANKSCYILRPISIPSHLEVSIMVGASTIDSCDGFLDSICNKNREFPVTPDRIRFFYNNSQDGEMAYQKTADLCEIMINDTSMGYDYKLPLPRRSVLFFIKYIYDSIMYEYGLRFKTPDYIISFLNHIPLLKKTAFKLALFNNDLYHSNRLLAKYEDEFRRIIDRINNAK